MEPQEWDRIADLLMQIRGKVDNILPTTKHGEFFREGYLQQIEILIRRTDQMAEIDVKGWL